MPPLKCKNPKCLYEWDYNGKSKFFATCPRCHYQVNVKSGAKDGISR
jgi:hypothetical protein